MAMFKRRTPFTTECIISALPADEDGHIRVCEGNHAGLNGARLTYRIFVGPIPHGQVVSRTCGTKGCVNPSHLYLRAKALACADAGRAGKVTPQQRWYVRRSPRNRKALAAEFGVTTQHVDLLRRDTNRGHEMPSLRYAILIAVERVSEWLARGRED